MSSSVVQKVFDTITDGDGDRLQKLIAKYPDIPQFTDEEGNTPIMHAILEEPDDVMEILSLLAFMSSPNLSHQNDDGQCALHLAVEANELMFVDFLVDMNRHAINIQDNKGETPLHLALRLQYDDIVSFLVMNTLPDFTLVTKRGKKTVLDYAQKYSTRNMYKLMSWMAEKQIQHSPLTSPSPTQTTAKSEAVKIIQTAYRQRMKTIQNYAKTSTSYLEHLSREDQEYVYRALNAGMMFGNFLYEKPFFFCTAATFDLFKNMIRIIHDAPTIPTSYQVYRGSFEAAPPAVGREYTMTLPFSTSLIKMYAFGWNFVHFEKECCLFKLQCPKNTSGLLVSKLPWESVKSTRLSKFYSNLSGTNTFHQKVHAQNEYIMAPHRIKVERILEMDLEKLDDTQKRAYVQHYLHDAKQRGMNKKGFDTEVFINRKINVYECSIVPLDIAQYRILDHNEFNKMMELDIPIAESFFIFAKEELSEKHAKLLSICKKQKWIEEVINKTSIRQSQTCVQSIPPHLRTARVLTSLFWQNTYPLPTVMEMLPSKPKQSKIMRLVSWNVHMWTDVFKVYKRTDMFRLIDAVQADMVCLQEVQDPKAVPTTMPSHFVQTANYHDLPFGNIIYAPNGFRDQPKNIGLGLYNGERRSAVYTKMYGIHIFNLHLDVYDQTGEERRRELETLMKSITELTKLDEPVLVCGDFNAIRRKDYSEQEWSNIVIADTARDIQTCSELEIMENNGFESAFLDIANDRRFANGTAWSGRVVDFIFVRNLKDKIRHTHVIPTNLSDHLMIGVDIDISS